ncbi:hypothetical protein [Botrimarina mediterranea]|uniref:hypothetical protein n=1 Tax=Botrimarina mediterranea TaxID=2528022 RepID=UPI00118C329F|nr:hypothetical protein K2D_16530 [Planctomycetes bacterium K2D]
MSDRCENCGDKLVPHCLACHEHEAASLEVVGAMLKDTSDVVAALTEQRDELSRDLGQALAAKEEAAAERDALRAALKAVEWTGISKQCPCCFRGNVVGHESGCQLSAVLALTEDAQG